MDRRTRIELSNLSAAIMAESGVDWLAARTKAARSLGLAQGEARQVTEADILSALQTRQLLFSPGAAADLLHLRKAALQVMRLLREFEPLLIGAIAQGTVTPYTPIEIQVQVDSDKDLELLLLNSGVGYDVAPTSGPYVVNYRCDRTEPVVLITANIRASAGNPRRGRSYPEALGLRDLEALVAKELG